MLHHIYRRAGFPFEWIERLCITGVDAADEAISIAEQQSDNAAAHLRTVLDQLLADTPESALRTRLYNARKVFFQKKKLPVGLKGHFESLDAALAGYENAADSLLKARMHADVLWAEGLTQGYAVLQEAARTEDFQRGLLFSSHSLLDRLPVFLQTPPERFSAKEHQIALGIARYLVRGATRCVPLSHWGVVAVPEQPEQGIFSQKTVKITPNVALLDAFYAILLNESSFYRSLQVRLNPSLKTTENGLLRWWFFNGTEEAIQQAIPNELTEFIVEWLEERARCTLWADLADALADAADTSPDIAEKHLFQYIDTGLIEWVLPERGTSPSWAGRLYQYIGTLSRPAKVLEEAAFTLQWLRTAARTLPFQNVAEARQTIQNTAAQLQTFFSNYGAELPPIPLEQLFYEDVMVVGEEVLPEWVRAELFDAVAEIWNTAPARPLSPLRRKLAPQAPERTPLPVTRSLGMTLRPFRNASGDWNAVLETLHPASGKLLGRWLHLLPSQYTEQLQSDYRQLPDTVVLTWHQRFNANIHPALTPNCLQLPGDGRPAEGLLLSGCTIKHTPEGNLQLIYGTEERLLRLTDPGLEAFESRPRLIKLLLLAGTPRISRELLPLPEWESLKTGILYRPRQMSGPIVTARAAWMCAPAIAELGTAPGGRRRWLGSGLPRTFMLHFDQESPLYIDLNSPLMCLFWEKQMKKSVLIYIEEVFPEYEDFTTEVAMERVE